MRIVVELPLPYAPPCMLHFLPCRDTCSLSRLGQPLLPRPTLPLGRFDQLRRSIARSNTADFPEARRGSDFARLRRAFRPSHKLQEIRWQVRRQSAVLTPRIRGTSAGGFETPTHAAPHVGPIHTCVPPGSHQARQRSSTQGPIRTTIPRTSLGANGPQLELRRLAPPLMLSGDAT